MNRSRLASFASLLLLLLAAACASSSNPATNKPPRVDPEEPAPAGLPATSNQKATTDKRGCLVVQTDYGAQPSIVEGTLRKTEASATNVAPFVLKLSTPRCIVGLPRASVITEVYVASTGADLRPMLDSPLRITGDVIGGTNDLGGPAVVILAKDFQRIDPPLAPQLQP